ncbi:MAG: hypothetical protein ACTSVU_03195 [Promethearchaeota archaeon]
MSNKNVRNINTPKILPIILITLILGMNLASVGLFNARIQIGTQNSNIEQSNNIDNIDNIESIPQDADQNNNSLIINKLGDINENGHPFSTFVNGDYAYFADGDFGLRILNISDKSNPIVVGQYRNEGITHDVQVVGNYAYIANGKEGLEILNITDPTNPEKVGQFKDKNRFSQIKVEGNRTYLSTDYVLIEIIDTSNLTNPYKLGEFNCTSYVQSIFDFDIYNGFVYISGGKSFHNNFLIYNTIDASNPILVHHSEDSCHMGGERIDIQGHFAYITYGYNYCLCFPSAFYILDISNPGNPGYITSVGGFDAYEIKVDGKFAYVGRGSGFSIFDISNCSLDFIPKEVGHYSGNGYLNELFVSEQYVYSTNWFEGVVKIFNTSEPSNITKIGEFNDGEYLETYEIKNNILYMIDTCYGLKIYDISDSENPELLGQCIIKNFDYSFAIEGNYAYFSYYKGFKNKGFSIINITDHSNPTLFLNYTVMDNIYDLVINGNYLYIVNGKKNMQIFDVSDPSNPIKLTNYEASINVYHIKIYENKAYLESAIGVIEIVDILNPEDPKQISVYHSVKAKYCESQKNTSFGSSPFDQLVVNEKHLYFSSLDFGIEIVDISNIKKPKFVSQFENGNFILNVQISGNYTWILDQTGFGVIDASNFEDIKQIGHYDIALQTKFNIIGNEIYSLSPYKLSIFNYTVNYTIPENTNTNSNSNSIPGMPLYWIMPIMGLGALIIIIKSNRYENVEKKKKLH